jgi:hypothetical protein
MEGSHSTVYAGLSDLYFPDSGQFKEQNPAKWPGEGILSV